jgi:membrane-associated phospholipid phosphatase
MRRIRPCQALALCATLVAAPPSRAQTAPDSAPPAILGGRDAVVGGSFAAGALVAHAFDQPLAERLQRPATQESRALHRTATTFRLAAQPGAIVVFPLLWGAGRVFDRPTMADVGLHTTESMVAATVGVTVVKMLVGRARPSVSVEHPNDVGFGRGFTRGEEYRSFPSGHTATAFAVASALTAEVMRRDPGSRWAAGVPLYAAASMVGWSRMYDDRHWASDVVAGAGFGTVAGFAVVRYHHARASTRTDRWLLGTSIGPHGVVPIVGPVR